MHVWRHEEKGEYIKNIKKKAPETEMRAEYDFSKGFRGKYAKRFSEGSNIILLDPDVAGLFADSKTVMTHYGLSPGSRKYEGKRPVESF